MYSLNGAKVKAFRMSQPYHIANVGQLGPGEITVNGMASTICKLDLTYIDGGVEVNGTMKGKVFRALIPVGNCVGMELFPETNNKASDKAK